MSDHIGFLFFFNDTATTEIYTLSLHDALPIYPVQKQVFAFMPWILMVLMAPFAAGLQLYWTVNNIISIGQQKLLYARHPVLKTQAAAPEPAAPAAPPPPPAPKGRRPKAR